MRIRLAGVARQYTGTAGKVTNCQIGVSVNLVTDTASCPTNWRLFLPASWDPASPDAGPDVAGRRDRAGIPDEIGHREKWRLALDMIDEMADWGLRSPLGVADAGYATRPSSATAGPSVMCPMYYGCRCARDLRCDTRPPPDLMLCPQRTEDHTMAAPRSPARNQRQLKRRLPY